MTEREHVENGPEERPRRPIGLILIALLVIVSAPVWSILLFAQLPPAIQEPLLEFERQMMVVFQPLVDLYKRFPAINDFYAWCFDRLG